MQYFSPTVLREAFRIFDSDKKGSIKLEMVKEILDLLGHEVDDEELEEVMEGLFKLFSTKIGDFNCNFNRVRRRRVR